MGQERSTPAGVTGQAKLPAESSSNGSLNEAPSVEQRAPKSNAPKTDGPRIGENGSYQPAEYEIVHVSEATPERPAQTHKLTRTDR